VELFAITIEAALILACVIFTVLLLLTKHLPAATTRNAFALYFSIAFVSFFYLSLNAQWIGVAQASLFIFVPVTIFLGYFFYGFTTSFMVQRDAKLWDRIALIIPAGISIAFLVFELLHFIYGDSSESLKSLRIFITESTLRFAFPLYNIILIVRLTLELQNRERSNRDQFADEQMNDLSWAKITVVIYAFFIIGMILSELVSATVSELVFNFSLLLLVLYVGYFEMKRIADYFSSAQLITEEQVAPSSVDTREDEPGHRKELFQSINNQIDTDKLFLQKDLSVRMLADLNKVNTKYISESINQNAGMNFNGFINEKRIVYAKQLIGSEATRELTLEAIANESGFRSKSSFNNAFKIFSGMTPSQFMKKAGH
jgi:AraC-like DNA-binding protein